MAGGGVKNVAMPLHLSDPLTSCERSLRSGCSILSHIFGSPGPHKKRRILSFYVTAPRLWNALPRNIREAKSLTVFKKMLKSHLYPKY